MNKFKSTNCIELEERSTTEKSKEWKVKGGKVTMNNFILGIKVL